MGASRARDEAVAERGAEAAESRSTAAGAESGGGSSMTMGGPRLKTTFLLSGSPGGGQGALFLYRRLYFPAPMRLIVSGLRSRHLSCKLPLEGLLL